jgi:ATP-dependent RNA helicase DeaD
MTFAEFGLPNQLKLNLDKMQFLVPTPIQAKAIPVVLKGKDVIGSAQTGTGKTAAFSLPLIDFLIKNPQKTAVILAPTRELAIQINDVIKQFVRGIPNCEPVILIGGASMHLQLNALRRNPRIFVATPGRLVDHLQHKSVDLSKTGMFVLDEADRMLDMGFAPQLKVIRKYIPESRQTLLFSATFPKQILDLTSAYLKNPVKIEVGEVKKPVQKITQILVDTIAKNKNDTLMDQLNARTGSVLVFARTKHRTDKVAKFLTEYGFTVSRIHGGRSQAQRQSALKGFRDGEFRILVATDIAARGIDVDHIETVINYDLPEAPEDYIHRIGRTGRNGKEGTALCLMTPEDKVKWHAITRFIDRQEGGGQPGYSGRGSRNSEQQTARGQDRNRPGQHQRFGKKKFKFRKNFRSER